ncbi:hypothetical protein BDV95DRAFT_262549 [Massariosphaeria phaeospora]|uniref:Uncharacterized protein n=1 Tax=Massariosphaeria phaeospora TaxID=100035 RepID=A0A7C8M6I0_9PLEO|nr:hypothetical protein BDV95DRAFT_262549 [Massariosphaeria phaeospora]
MYLHLSSPHGPPRDKRKHSGSRQPTLPQPTTNNCNFTGSASGYISFYLLHLIDFPWRLHSVAGLGLENQISTPVSGFLRDYTPISLCFYFCWRWGHTEGWLSSQQPPSPTEEQSGYPIDISAPFQRLRRHTCHISVDCKNSLLTFSFVSMHGRGWNGTVRHDWHAPILAYSTRSPAAPRLGPALDEHGVRHNTGPKRH